jgi:hypothetical protein
MSDLDTEFPIQGLPLQTVCQKFVYVILTTLDSVRNLSTYP